MLQQAPPLPVHQPAKSNQLIQPVDHKHKVIVYTNRIQVFQFLSFRRVVVMKDCLVGISPASEY
jgi:hypothetical protein